MRIAFYAPLKAPDHPVPSGDRAMARLLIRALQAGGHAVDVACDLRSYAEHETDQAPIRAAANSEIDRLREAWATAPNQAPDLWFTYHLYYRAPDWIGPPMARLLNIPYVVAEASFAMKRATGVWSMGHDAVRQALRQAGLVLALARGDIAGLAKVPVPESRIVPLAPFVDVGALQRASGAVPKRQARAALLGGDAAAGPVLLAVGMMRHRAKLESYRLLAQALGQLADLDWTLVIVGDGPARGRIEALFAGLPAARVRFLGAVPADAMAPVYQGADIFTWPGVNEAYGMVYLEAQSCGVPVVATDSGGVANVVHNGTSGILVGAGQAGAYADALGRLITDAAKRQALGRCAQRFVAETHSLEQAGRTIGRGLAKMTVEGKSKP